MSGLSPFVPLKPASPRAARGEFGSCRVCGTFNQIPGLDSLFCPKCGWVPTKEEVARVAAGKERGQGNWREALSNDSNNDLSSKASKTIRPKPGGGPLQFGLFG